MDEAHREVRGRGDGLDGRGRVVGGVVDEDDLEVDVVEGRTDAADQLGDVPAFVEGGNDDGKIHGDALAIGQGQNRLSLPRRSWATPVRALSVLLAPLIFWLPLTDGPQPICFLRALTPMP
jgi:hypothetical protein